MDINLNINFNNNKTTLNLILIGILILAAALRFYNLDFQGAWLDELHTLKEADPKWSLKEFHEVNMFREGIPHLYFLIVRFFGALFGHSLYTVRLVSVLFGIVGVYGIYLLGKAISTKQTGYIAALLLAVHPFHIEYSQEGRSYSMLILFVILAFYRLVLFLKKNTIKNAIYLGLFSGLITNAHPIGIVSVIGVFLVIALYFFTLKSNQERIEYIKHSFLSGIISLIVFSPVYPKVVNASSITSFWVSKPTYDYVLSLLSHISGGNTVLFILFLASFFILSIWAVINTIKQKNFSTNSAFFHFVLLFVLIVFYFSFILIKSSGPVSLMLDRYLSPILPGLILSLALTISIIRNNIIKIATTLFFTSLLLYFLFVQKDYYNVRVKAQFNDLTEEVISFNVNNETIVSNWGWLLSYYLDRENTIKNVYEKNLDNHINDIKTNSIEQESFWYLDGNSRPYNVLPETEQFLNESFILEKTIELHDCWARHYVSKKAKKNDEVIFKLNQFSNAQFDGSGNLMFFENSKSVSPKIILESGSYEIEIVAMSFPNSKINNENSKFNVSVNSKFLAEIEASEQKLTSYKFEYLNVNANSFQIEIEFINDFAKDNLDRNLQISKIQLKKTIRR